MSKKLYFSNLDGGEACRTISQWKDYMKFEMLKTGTLFKANIDRTSGYGYCIQFYEFTEKGETCGKKICRRYAPRNGKSGMCKHQRPCYDYDDDKGILISIK